MADYGEDIPLLERGYDDDDTHTPYEPPSVDETSFGRLDEGDVSIPSSSGAQRTELKREELYVHIATWVLSPLKTLIYTSIDLGYETALKQSYL